MFARVKKDHMHGVLTYDGKDHKFSGSWLESASLDGNEIWKQQAQQGKLVQDPIVTLFSDCNNRKEIKLFISGDLDGANNVKQEIED